MKLAQIRQKELLLIYTVSFLVKRPSLHHVC